MSSSLSERPGWYSASEVPLYPPLHPLVCPEMFTTTSALLATYTGYEAFFLLPWQYHSVSWSEASLGAKIHLCGWIQSWIRPQINSCIIMIKSWTVYRLPFIISFIQRPVYTTKVQETADTLKDASTILQIKHECYIYASCLFHLRLLWCLWLVSLAPLASLSCTAPQQRRPCWVM